MQSSFVLKNRSNQELLAGAKRLVGEERNTTAHLIAHLVEIDARKLYLDEGYSCLSRYCIEALGLSEEAAYRRVDAARIAARYPMVMEMLAQGAIHLTTLRILGACLTDANHRHVLETAKGKRKEALGHLAATLRPKPDVPAVLRKLPDIPAVVERAASSEPLFAVKQIATLVSTEASEGMRLGAETVASIPVAPPTSPRKPVLAPLSPERYKVQLTVDTETYQALRQLQELLRHQVPNGDLATIVKDAVLQRLEQVKREKLGQVKRPRTKQGRTQRQGSWIQVEHATSLGEEPKPRANSRHIPSEVKRRVWTRDQGRCAFVSQNGHRCSERNRLEFHHITAYALGGRATVENIALRCRAHNAHEGAILFGGNGKKFTGSGASRSADHAQLTKVSAFRNRQSGSERGPAAGQE